MKKSLSTLWGLLLIASLAIGQVLVRVPSSVEPQATDITIQAASKKADAFLDLIGLERQEWGSGRGILRQSYDSTGRTWHLSGPKYSFSVESVAGRVTAFENLVRSDQRYHGRGRTGAVACTETEAKNLVGRLATKLGVPANAQVTSWGYRLRGTGQDSDACGVFGATYSIGRKPIATMSFDIQDAVPLDIWLK